MTALFVARPLFPSEAVATHGDGVTVVMLWIALAAFWLIAALVRPKNSPRPSGGGPGVRVRFGRLEASVMVFLLFIAAATYWAVGHGSPRPAINVFWEWMALGLCFLLARQLIETQREVRALAAVMIALAVAISSYGLYQRAYEFPETRRVYNADPDAALRAADLWIPPDSPQRKLYEDRLANDEPTATFALTNSLAGFLAPWLVVLAGIACCNLRNRKRLIGAVIIFVPMSVCLFLTHSRSGCLAALFGLALAWPVARGKISRFGWKIPSAIILTGVVLIVAAAAIGKLDYETAQKSLGYRLQYWRSSMSMIADYPWLGCGPGNFKYIYTQYKLPEASEVISDPHNFLVEIWATAGTPALLAFLAVLCIFGWKTCKIAKKREERGERREENSTADEKLERGGRNHDPACRPSPDAWQCILLGGAAGFLLSFPLGMLSAAPPNIMAFALGLPAACIAVALLFGWIRDGRMPPLLPTLAVAVLLINLLAAGGIIFPGVAGSLWLLMALGLQGDKPKLAGKLWNWTALAVIVVLGIVCYRTAYSPVLKCQTLLGKQTSNFIDPTNHRYMSIKAAIAADPWSAEPWRHLAVFDLTYWFESFSDGRTNSLALDSYRCFEEAVGNIARLEPNSSSNWAMIGDWYSVAAAKYDKNGKKTAPEAARKALDAYRRTVELYPNSAMNRAKLAEACRSVGDFDGFRREAESSLWLDKVTPHADKKLPDDVRKRLTAGLADK